ncbi:MAG: DUF3820 family protein [Waddliaceae bacterium]
MNGKEPPNSIRFIYYDTETTGIHSEKDRIIEIAAYDSTQKRTFEMLVNPACPIPEGATAIHHITDEMVANQPDFSEAGKKFVEFCQGDVLLIAHNNDNFDQHFLNHEFSRHNLPMPSWQFADSLKWARRYRPDLPEHNLQFLRKIYGIAPNQAHRALDDVMVLCRIFEKLIDDLSAEDVITLLNQPRDITVMPFGKYQGHPLKKVPAEYIKWLASKGAFDKKENQELRKSFEKQGLLAK